MSRNVMSSTIPRRDGSDLRNQMCATGRRQFDVAHALATHFGQGNFDAALFTDHATMLEALIFSAQTFVVFDRPEYLGAKQPVALRFERAIVNGFRLFHFAVGPRTDLFGRSQTDLDRVELFLLCNLLE